MDHSSCHSTFRPVLLIFLGPAFSNVDYHGNNIHFPVQQIKTLRVLWLRMGTFELCAYIMCRQYQAYSAAMSFRLLLTVELSSTTTYRHATMCGKIINWSSLWYRICLRNKHAWGWFMLIMIPSKER